MRHWLWFKTDGGIGGDERITGGWNPALNFNDPDSPNPVVQKLRADRTAEPDFEAFLAYDCACDPELLDCSCGSNMVGTHCIDDPLGTPTLVAKPLMQMTLNASPVANGVQEDRGPGLTANLVLEEIIPGSIPDGVEIAVKHDLSKAQIVPAETTVTFAGGACPAVVVTIPGQGVVGACNLVPVNLRDTMSMKLVVRGWA